MNIFKPVLSSRRRIFTLSFILSNGFGVYCYLHPTEPSSEICLATGELIINMVMGNTLKELQG